MLATAGWIAQLNVGRRQLWPDTCLRSRAQEFEPTMAYCDTAYFVRLWERVQAMVDQEKEDPSHGKQIGGRRSTTRYTPPSGSGRDSWYHCHHRQRARSLCGTVYRGVTCGSGRNASFTTSRIFACELSTLNIGLQDDGVILLCKSSSSSRCKEYDMRTKIHRVSAYKVQKCTHERSRVHGDEQRDDHQKNQLTSR